jgi:hypothetical protein
MGPGAVWMGAENFAPTGIRSSDRPVRSESLIPTLSRQNWVLLFLAIFTKWISNIMYVYINIQLINFRNCFGVAW